MIAVFGAGAIGCWVGGRLAAGGASVTLIGRDRVIDELADGVRVSELAGPTTVVPVMATTNPEAVGRAAIVLVTVKSAQTAEAAATLAARVRPRAIVVSLQNGVHNTRVLRAALPGHTVLGAMVPFNVVRRGPGAYHRASSGSVMIERDPAATPLLDACHAAGLPVEPRRDIRAVLWAKLVMNLNNAINALSGLPLATELADRGYRRCLAAAQREAIGVLDAARQPLARLTRLPPRWMPHLLRVPDAVFGRLAARIVTIDPDARSSMWDDLEAHRPTEIDYLQGEIVALAREHGRAAPVNAALVRLVRDAETGGNRTWTADALWAAITAPTA